MPALERGGAARAPRAALDVDGRRLHWRGPGRKDGVGERVAQCAAGVLVARIAEDRLRVGLDHTPHWEAPMQHLTQEAAGW